MLQLWLSMIADVNDEKVTIEAERDEELRRIRTEALNMAQDREVQDMLIQERYDRMDWLTYGNEREARGEVKGEIKGAIKLYRDEMNLTSKEIIKKIMARFDLKQEVVEKYVEETLGLQLA